MRKSSAERQRDFRQRRKERQAAELAARRPPEESRFLEAMGAHLPGDDAPNKDDRPRTGPKGVSFVRGEITREWVLDQLRLFAVDPARGTPAAVQALKVLLQEIPKGDKPLSAAEQPVIVKNVVRVVRPNDKTLEHMINERAEALGLDPGLLVAPPVPRARMIGDEDGVLGRAPNGEPPADTSGESDEDV